MRIIIICAVTLGILIYIVYLFLKNKNVSVKTANTKSADDLLLEEFHKKYPHYSGFIDNKTEGTPFIESKHLYMQKRPIRYCDTCKVYMREPNDNELDANGETYRWD